MSDQQDPELLRARTRELEALCAELLVEGVDIGLPRPLLNRLWAAVGHGQLPHAFSVESSTPRTVQIRQETMEIPDMPLSARPVAAFEKTRSTPAPHELKPLTTRTTVCVVDDDPMMLDVLERVLQRENFELLLASGGAELIEKLNGYCGRVELLVTDYSMPGMQGRELAERVRQTFPAVKVLYQTGFSELLFGDRPELEEGAAFLEKPFTARGLREAARLVLFGSINP